MISRKNLSIATARTLSVSGVALVSESSDVFDLLMEAVVDIDGWGGVSEDDRPAASARIRRDLNYDLPKVAALGAALQERLPRLGASVVTACVETTFRYDESLAELADALAGVR